jgi:hypothetical protein
MWTEITIVWGVGKMASTEARDHKQRSSHVLIKIAWDKRPSGDKRPSSRWRTFRHVGPVCTTKFPSITGLGHKMGLTLTANRVIGPRFRLLVPREAFLSNGQPPGKVGNSSKVAVSCWSLGNVRDE